jgi:rSAM/selenodomain-associated transferase 1
MTALDVRVLVLAKAPIAGRVKTRLCPPYTPEQAATLAAAALADTLRAVAYSAASQRTLVLDGRSDLVSADGFEVVQQGGGGLDERIAAAFAAHAAAPMPQILVGMDTPQLTAELLDQAMAALPDTSVDAVIGPAEDGGFWVVGLRCRNADAFVGVPMSRPWTYLAQRERFDRLGLRVATLPALRDVDDASDARCVADLAPSTAFAAALREMDDEMAALC